jgi:hypothetical protein
MAQLDRAAVDGAGEDLVQALVGLATRVEQADVAVRVDVVLLEHLLHLHVGARAPAADRDLGVGLLEIVGGVDALADAQDVRLLVDVHADDLDVLTGLVGGGDQRVGVEQDHVD